MCLFSHDPCGTHPSPGFQERPLQLVPKAIPCRITAPRNACARNGQVSCGALSCSSLRFLKRVVLYSITSIRNVSYRSYQIPIDLDASGTDRPGPVDFVQTRGDAVSFCAGHVRGLCFLCDGYCKNPCKDYGRSSDGHPDDWSTIREARVSSVFTLMEQGPEHLKALCVRFDRRKAVRMPAISARMQYPIEPKRTTFRMNRR